LSESWEKCFNKAHKIHIEPKAKLENTISSEEIFSDSGISDLSSDGEFLETDTETESCSYIQSKSKLTRIHQKKLLMCSAELSVKKMLEENGKDVDRYIKQFQSFLSSRKVDRLLSYVGDLEKITILMHSLARRLATTELKLSKKQGNELLLQLKIQKLSRQIEDAKIIKCSLDAKFSNILRMIEAELGHEQTLNFVLMMDSKMKLIITAKEIDDKNKLLDLKLQSL